MDAAMHKFKSLGRTKPSEGLGAELEDLARAATKKTLLAPDDELNGQVVDEINNSNADPACPTLVVDMLHRRLTQSNPHKVWLATVLAGKVLEKCPTVLAGVKDEIYHDLGQIAAKPLDRYQANFKAEQQAKMNAFSILRSSGKQAQNVLRKTAGLGRMVSLTPAKVPRVRPRSRTPARDATESSNSSTSRPAAEETVAETAKLIPGTEPINPPSKGRSVKHVSGKDAAMNAAKDEKHKVRDSKNRAARAAKEDEKAGRGTVGDTPEEAARAATAAAAAVATSKALADATAAASERASERVSSKSRGRASGGKHPSWDDTKESVTTSIGIAGSHTEMIQDLVKNLTSGNSAAPDFERLFLDDLVKEMTQFRSAFEQLMALLTTFRSTEASALLSRALRSIDEMNSTMSMYQDVVHSMPVDSGTDSGAEAVMALPVRSRSRELPASHPQIAADPLSQYAPAAKMAPLAGYTSHISPVFAPNPATNLISMDEVHSMAGQQGLQRAGSAGSGGAFTGFMPAPQQQMAAAGWAGQQPNAGPGQPMPYGYMQGPMYHPGQYPGAPQNMSYMPWGAAAPPQVMYMPVTGPNGEQGFAPVPMPMQFQQQGAPSAPAAPGGVSFVQGPNGYYMPVPMGTPAAAPVPLVGTSMAASSAQMSNPFAVGSEAASSPVANKSDTWSQPQHGSMSVPVAVGNPFTLMSKAGSGGTPGGTQQLPPLPRTSSNGSISARTSVDLAVAGQRSNASSNGSLPRPDSENALNGSLGDALQHDLSSGNSGITARRHDSTGSGIFPSQAADSVLDGTGMRAWSGSISPPSAPGSSGQGGFNGEGSQKGTSPEPASHSAEVSPAKELQYGAPPRDTRLDGDGRAPGHAPGSARTAQDPTFDAIFDDILAS